MIIFNKKNSCAYLIVFYIFLNNLVVAQNQIITSCPDNFEQILCIPWIIDTHTGFYSEGCHICPSADQDFIQYEIGFYYSYSLSEPYYYFRKVCANTQFVGGVDKYDFYDCYGTLVEEFYDSYAPTVAYAVNDYFHEFGSQGNYTFPPYTDAFIKMYDCDMLFPECDDVLLAKECFVNLFEDIDNTTNYVCGSDGNLYSSVDIMNKCYGVSETADPSECNFICGNGTVEGGEEEDGCGGEFCPPCTLNPEDYTLVITEIMYNPPESGTDSLEFIEITNIGTVPIDVEGVYFSSGIELVFSSRIIDPSESVIVAQNLNAINNSLANSLVIGTTDWIQWSNGALRNGGELLTINTPSGEIIDSLTYSDTSPWPTLAEGTDGGGASIKLCNYTADNSVANNWKASTFSTCISVNNLEIKASPMRIIDCNYCYNLCAFIPDSILIGSICDDGDPNTMNDVILDDCSCGQLNGCENLPNVDVVNNNYFICMGEELNIPISTSDGSNTEIIVTSINTSGVVGNLPLQTFVGSGVISDNLENTTSNAQVIIYEAYTRDGTCYGDTIQIAITIFPPLIVDLGEYETCKDSCIEIIPSVSGGSGQGYAYSWSNNNNSPNIVVCPSTEIQYSLTVSDDAGCTGTGIANVTLLDETVCNTTQHPWCLEFIQDEWNSGSYECFNNNSVSCITYIYSGVYFGENVVVIRRDCETLVGVPEYSANWKVFKLDGELLEECDYGLTGSCDEDGDVFERVMSLTEEWNCTEEEPECNDCNYSWLQTKVESEVGEYCNPLTICSAFPSEYFYQVYHFQTNDEYAIVKFACQNGEIEFYDGYGNLTFTCALIYNSDDVIEPQCTLNDWPFNINNTPIFECTNGNSYTIPDFNISGDHPDFAPLMALYESTNGDQWTNTTDGFKQWGLTCNPCDGNWFGIECENNRVTCISLAYNPNMPDFVRCDAHTSAVDNNVVGSIPKEIGEISELKFLSIQNAELNGSIPEEFYNLENLESVFFNRIDLAKNNISGNISESISNLDKLMWFNLSYQNLSGPLPDAFGSFEYENMTYLELQGNNFEGCIPMSYNSKCPREFYFHENPLLPWAGDFDQFCMTPDQQEGAPCGNMIDSIIVNCECNPILIPAVKFYLEQKEITSEYLDMNVSLIANLPLSAVQLGVVWDGNDLLSQSVDINSSVLPGLDQGMFSMNNTGELSLGWIHPSGLSATLVDTNLLFTVRFDLISDTCVLSDVSVTDEFIAIEIIDENFNYIPFELDTITVTYEGPNCNCINRTINIDAIDPFCANFTEQPVDLNATVQPIAQGSEVWNGVGVSNNQWDPSGLNEGSYSVYYEFIDDNNCSYYDTLMIEVIDVSTVDINIDSTAVCQSEVSVIDIVNMPEGFNFEWIFHTGSGEVNQIDSDSYELTWNQSGNASIQLVFDQGNCISETDNIEVQVEPIQMPLNIECDPTSESVLFSWPSNECNDDYSILINGNEVGTIQDTFILIDNLQEGEEIEINIIPNQLCLCPVVTSSLMCESTPCPSVTVDIVEDITTFCSGDSTIFTFDVDISNASNGDISWIGTYLSQNGEIQPSAIPIGLHDVIVEYDEMNCKFRDTLNIEVVNSPMGSLTASLNSVCIDSIVTFTYQGEMVESLMMDWDLGDANFVSETLSSQSVFWSEIGVKSIKVIASNNSCTSPNYELSIAVEDCSLDSCQIQLVDDALEISINELVSFNVLNNDQIPTTYSVDLIDFDSEFDGLFLDENGDISFTILDPFGGELAITYEVCSEDCVDCETAQLVVTNKALAEITQTDVISPNGDGSNDALRFTSEDVMEGSKLWIYNRWGDQIYFQENYTNDWEAKGYPGGVYFYVLEVYGVVRKSSLTVIK